MKTFVKYAKSIKSEYYGPMRKMLLLNYLQRKIKMTSIGLY